MRGFLLPIYHENEICIHDLLSLVYGKPLTADTMDGILAIFTYHYSREGKYLFIPYHALKAVHTEPEAAGEDKESSKEEKLKTRFKEEDMRRRMKKLERATAVFAIFVENDHWGLLRLDLKEYKIYLWDSFAWKNPDKVVDRIIMWMAPLGAALHSWEEAKGNITRCRFKEGHSYVESGIQTAVTLESQLNTCNDWKQYSTVSRHRLRYLQLLSGTLKVF